VSCDEWKETRIIRPTTPHHGEVGKPALLGEDFQGTVSHEAQESAASTPFKFFTAPA